MTLQKTETAPPKSLPLKSPWAQIVKAEPKQKDQASVQAPAKSQLTKHGSNASAATSKQEPQAALPSYAKAGVSQRPDSQGDSRRPAPTISTERQPAETSPADVDKHAPATPVASTSPVPPSDSSSSTAEKSREDTNAAEASTSRGSEAEVF